MAINRGMVYSLADISWHRRETNEVSVCVCVCVCVRAHTRAHYPTLSHVWEMCP